MALLGLDHQLECEPLPALLRSPFYWASQGKGEFAVPVATESPKLNAAVAAASLVSNGMVVGLGSGSTAALMVRRLGERIEQEGLKITAIATSVETARLAGSLGIPVHELDTVLALDINLDGADEIDPQFRMIKGRGGALLREKIVASASNHRVTMIVAEKRVDRLGSTVAVPVEVSSIGLKHTERRLRLLGCSTTIRRRPDGSSYMTDGGNQIIDCRFNSIDDPESLDRELQCMAGVLDTGFFIGLCDTLIVGTDNGAEQIDTGVRPRPTGLSLAAGS
jgi:ribose 5-phosphate isomerase A